MNYKVVETFVSINGEGKKSGELAVFTRLAGCNLRCSYCDTMWANQDDVVFTLMSKEEIYDYIKSSGVKNVTLTGGEPLIQEGVGELIDYLMMDENLCIEVETNGSIAIQSFRKNHGRRLSFTMDYKGSSSLMEDKMLMKNFETLTEFDTVKFVVGNKQDLFKAKEIMDNYHLTEVCHVFFSPIYGDIDGETIVEFMKSNRLNRVRLQIQLHKIIWSPEERGV
ncbi:putative 7-carboxy-7-deazaguanine synthase QueE [uncultured Ilyobacter sp.]|uniref:putative 7-carboxy-7-deazaguanine synthase QueE n=1 Tax=uncultured Ilyobacter sp. TaxID=544433 RepID=UPI0029C8F042|nr:putative 7-carboxy-7-deazaguanine synthase QueE [uncultured Ilyobacter sp.]